MKVGFIGTGSMGSILIKAFIQSGALQPDDIIASNRTASKAHMLREQFPGLHVVQANSEVIHSCELVFICVKPLEFRPVIEEIKHGVNADQMIVSITSPVLVEQLEQQLSCKIAKVIPSITNRACSGASLCIYGRSMTDEDRQKLEQLLSYISKPQVIAEHHTRVSSDITSCGPAFISLIIEKMIEAAVQETGISSEEATSLASQMLLGTGKLLTSGTFTPASLQQRVSVPGGITAVGLEMMSSGLEGLFNELFRTTHRKFYDDVMKVRASFASLSNDNVH